MKILHVEQNDYPLYIIPGSIRAHGLGAVEQRCTSYERKMSFLKGMKKKVYQLAASNKIMEQLVSSLSFNSNMLVGL